MKDTRGVHVVMVIPSNEMSYDQNMQTILQPPALETPNLQANSTGYLCILQLKQHHHHRRIQTSQITTLPLQHRHSLLPTTRSLLQCLPTQVFEPLSEAYEHGECPKDFQQSVWRDRLCVYHTSSSHASLQSLLKT